MMNEEPPYGTIAWFFYEIDEKQRQIYELVFDIDQKLAKISINFSFSFSFIVIFRI